MSEREQTARVVGGGLNRCPYCHDGIEVEQDGWVACGRCLSRHHPGCWDEAGACASCGHSQALGLNAATPPREPKTLSQLQAEAFAAFEPEQQTLPRFLRNLSTLGLSAAFRSEREFLEHKRQNQAHEPAFSEVERVDLKLKLYRVHASALSQTSGDTYRRGLPALALLALITLPIVAALAAGGVVDPFVLELYAGGLLFGYPFLLQLHMNLFRESVVRHEHGQQLARLVARGAEASTIEELRTAGRKSWSRLRIEQVLLSVTGCIPLLGLAMLIWIPNELRRIVAKHHAHEGQLDDACPLAPREPEPEPELGEPEPAARPTPPKREKP